MRHLAVKSWYCANPTQHISFSYSSKQAMNKEDEPPEQILQHMSLLLISITRILERELQEPAVPYGVVCLIKLEGIGFAPHELNVKC